MAEQVHGIVFPEIGGDRSSTRTGQQVFAAAAAATDADLSSRIAAERNWYGTYDGYARQLEEAQLRAPGTSVAVAAAGLEKLHELMEYVRDDEVSTVRSALDLDPARKLSTVEVAGAGERHTQPEVPYRGRVLRGDDLRRQLDDWQQRDVVETTFAEAVHRVMDEPDWLDLRDTTVAVMGGASEMGPLEWLSRWGATTAVVDLAKERLWNQILTTVRAGAGRALVPAAGEAGDLAATAGVDLFTELPVAWDWLQRVPGPLVLGNYVYAHGSINVQVSMAVDAIIEQVLARGDGSSVAVLATPTDVYAVPDDAVVASRRRWDERRAVRRVVGSLSGGRLFQPNYPDGPSTDFGVVVDSQITQQGCNYSLAKRLHRWRAMVARDAGAVSSINVAPATRTKSVTDNRILKAAYAAASAYDIEVFEPETARAVMALLLVHDLRNPDAGAQPSADLVHPLALLGDGACHSGLWRTPFAPGSVLPLAAARGLARPSTHR